MADEKRKIKTYSEDEIILFEKPKKIQQEAIEIMSEEGMMKVIEGEPFTVITTPGSHWFEGVVLIGYTGVTITNVVHREDPDGNYVLIDYTTDQDQLEKNSHHQVTVHDETPPIDVLDYTPRALVGLKSYHLNRSGDSGWSSEPVNFRQSFSKPLEGELGIEKAILIQISDKINDKHLKGLSPHFGGGRLYATKTKPTK